MDSATRSRESARTPSRQATFNMDKISPDTSRGHRYRQFRTAQNSAQQPRQTKIFGSTEQTSSAQRTSIPTSSCQPGLVDQSQSSEYGATNTVESSPQFKQRAVAPFHDLPHETDARSTPKPPRNVLRRKQTSVARGTSRSRLDSHQAESARTGSSSSSSQPGSSVDSGLGSQLDRDITQSPAEIRVARTLELPTTQAHTVTIYPELDRYRSVEPRLSNTFQHSPATVPHRLATHDLPPPTPSFSGTSSQLSTASPSTRFSESPGPGPYSRDTTPTSMSSQSPGLVAPKRFAPHQKTRQLSPALNRPPVTRMRASSAPKEIEVAGPDTQGLAAVRESLTSSSSNSTVRDVERREKGKVKGTKAKRRLSPLPPSPPPRKSSQKFREGRNDAKPSTKRSLELTPPPLPSLSPLQSPARPSSASTSRVTPPTRPSRDNTPDLPSQLFAPPPVIHSNLCPPSPGTERQVTEPGLRDSMPRRAIPSPCPARSEQADIAPINRGPTPAPRTAGQAQETPGYMLSKGRATRTPSPSTTFNTRFPFLSRRAKTESELPRVSKKDKTTRKGPVAGTGHEGYGRLGSTRRRSGGPSSSQDSLNSSTSTDAFLRERLNPVVISGGEIIENRNVGSDMSRSESEQSFSWSRQSMESRVDSETSTTSSAGRTAMWASGLPRNPKDGLSRRRVSDSSDSEAAMRSTLAFRRSSQWLHAPTDQGSLRLPKPINTSGAASPSMISIDRSIVSDESHSEIDSEAIRGREPPGGARPKKLIRRARSPRKWNLFSRSQHQSKKKPEEPGPVSATVKVVYQKPMAYYAMIDGSEQEESEPPTVEDVLRDAQVFDDPLDAPLDVPRPPALGLRERLPSQSRNNSKLSAARSRVDPSQTLPPSIRQSGNNDDKLPSSDVADAASSDVEAGPVAKPLLGRPSRLHHVGRIPKVVNSGTDCAPAKSFSRPFNRASYQTPVQQQVVVDHESIAKGPSPPKPLTPNVSPHMGEAATGEAFSGEPHRRTPSESPEIRKEFFTISPNEKYRAHSSSSSSCSGAYLFTQAMAAIPDPDGPLVEDEIWDEYNDLIGDAPPSATSSKGIPFHLESHGVALAKTAGKALESPTLAPPSAKSMTTLTDGVAPTESSTFNADMTDRIKAAFAPKPDESQAAPTINLSKSHQDGNYSQSVDLGQAKSVTHQQRDGQRNSGSSRKSVKSDSGSSCKSSEDDSALAQVNLRVGSMTVSKWLSFGHVLFSPAREDLTGKSESLNRQSVLVIDGLGNDDWSFYAAETYPAATFFNLSPRAPLPAEHKTASSFPLSPPNHHQIQYLSHMDKFPFGAESFTSVVYRFPAAGPEAHYRNIVSEARRVLKPGSYIELSVLDVDLNNMGNRGRRAVRRLKERIHEAAPDTTLSSVSDLVLRLLGSAGFSDIKSCHVGVPVASTVTDSRNSGNASSVSGPKKPREQRSLADMMNDNSELADEGITKMVAKVGRWWYTRCYENAIGDNASVRSVWANRALLSECQELGTSLKLMVCYARVPERSRVASI